MSLDTKFPARILFAKIQAKGCVFLQFRAVHRLEVKVSEIPGFKISGFQLVLRVDQF